MTKPVEKTEGKVVPECEVLHGDCLEVLKGYPDEYFSACITDPPYGLSKEPDVAEVMRHWLAGDAYEHGSARKGKQHCANHILRNAIVGDSHNLNADISKNGVQLRISLPALLVGGRDIKLYDEVFVREEEVGDESSGFVFEDVLVNKGNAQLAEAACNSKLGLRVREGASPCVGVCSCFTKLGEALYRVPVWLRDDSAAEAEGAPGVVAFAGTKRAAVLTLDLRGRTGELALAEGAGEFDAAFELVSSELVRALPRASGFAPELQSGKVGDVAVAANRAVTFDLFAHADLLERLEHPIIPQNGFMGRSWDSFVPGPEYWREVYRTMKPGAHLLAFAGTRTWDLLSMAIRLAGFENRDTIRHHQGVPSLAWVFGSGFPKSTSISKQLDKMAGAEREVVGLKTRPDGTQRPNTPDWTPGCVTYAQDEWTQQNFAKQGHLATAPATDAAKRWEGWHTSLKPAWEIILVFRKPLSASSVARQVLQNGCGALNVDASRIGHNEPESTTTRTAGRFGSNTYARDEYSLNMNGGNLRSPSPAGRFPSNFLLSHIPGPNGCQRVGTKKVKGSHDTTGVWSSADGESGGDGYNGNLPLRTREERVRAYTDPDGMEEVENWECARDEAGNYVCPVALLDEMSGVSKSSGGRTNNAMRSDNAIYGKGRDDIQKVDPGFGDRGGASRFFAQFPGEPAYCQEPPESDNSDVLSSQNDNSVVLEPDTDPGFVYRAKAATRERWGILKCKDNNHRLSDVEPFAVLKPLAKNGECALCGSGLKVDGHPTQKPQDLMKYLLRLVVSPGGTVLDPFAGSGSTLVAACELGIDVVGVEADEEFVSIMQRRLDHVQAETSSRLPL